jgi:hypothetical protein
MGLALIALPIFLLDSQVVPSSESIPSAPGGQGMPATPVVSLEDPDSARPSPLAVFDSKDPFTRSSGLDSGGDGDAAGSGSGTSGGGSLAAGGASVAEGAVAASGSGVGSGVDGSSGLGAALSPPGGDSAGGGAPTPSGGGAPSPSGGGAPSPSGGGAACEDFSTQAEAQRAANTRDRNKNGIYCEDRPCPCEPPRSSSPSPSPSSQPSHRRETIPARITAVIDGDTIKVLTASQERYTVRLIGIDTPVLWSQHVLRSATSWGQRR